jgi:hypothetical protein
MPNWTRRAGVDSLSLKDRSTPFLPIIVTSRTLCRRRQAALKHLYSTVVSLDPTGRGRRRWTNRWKAALNAFDTAFDGRVSAGRK